MRPRAAAQREITSGEEADERLSGLLDRHIAALASAEQQLVRQKYFERLSVREIAAQMETSEKAVESKLARIRQKLKMAALAELNDEAH